MIDNKQLVKIVRKHAENTNWQSGADYALERLGLRLRDDKNLRLDKNVDQPQISENQLRLAIENLRGEWNQDAAINAALTEVTEAFGLAQTATGTATRYNVTWSAVVSHDELVRRGWTGNGDPERFARAYVLAGNGFSFNHQAA